MPNIQIFFVFSDKRHIFVSNSEQMCLLLKKSVYLDEGTVAKHDIVCYKVIAKGFYDEPQSGIKYFYQTPCACERVDIDIIEKNGEFATNKYGRPCYGTSVLSIGWIHTYKTLRGAWNLISCLAYESGPKSYLQVYKCVIPKGTCYFEGEDLLTDKTSYASDKIRFVAQIKKR